jgi:hypothetical protein
MESEPRDLPMRQVLSPVLLFAQVFQIQEILMKSAVFVSCALLGFLASSLAAQTSRPQARRMTVDVPFDFMIEQTMFPAGRYTVAATGGHNFYLHASQGLESLGFATQAVADLHAHPASLVFTEDGGHYHLHELWMNSSVGGEVSVPATEELSSVLAERVEVPANCANCE